jgi:carbamoyltransferase
LDGIFRHVYSLAPAKTHFISEQVWKRGGNIAEARKAVIRKAIQGHPREEVAGSAQRILEETILGHVQWALRQTGKRKLAMAGGVFGNVKLNQHLMELPEVDEIFVFPAMSDSGLAVAAAQIASLEKINENKAHERMEFMKIGRPLKDVYLGPEYSEEEIAQVLAASEFHYEKASSPGGWAARAAKFIANGGILGHFHGRMEFGPRALGNRSILGSPVDANINDELNKRLSRSDFMPFAPSVLAEACDDIFENFRKGAHSAEFMTVTYTVKESWRERIPAVVHVDGTARPQAVRSEVNPRFHKIIQEFFSLTTLPVVINTSFNVHEEPIVCKPQEALQALREKRIDALLLEDFWVTQSKT